MQFRCNICINIKDDHEIDSYLELRILKSIWNQHIINIHKWSKTHQSTCQLLWHNCFNFSAIYCACMFRGNVCFKESSHQIQCNVRPTWFFPFWNGFPSIESCHGLAHINTLLRDFNFSIFGSDVISPFMLLWTISFENRFDISCVLGRINIV